MVYSSGGMVKMNVKQIIVVREDLDMSRGKLAAQVAHASMKNILDIMTKKYDGNTTEWSLNLNCDLDLKEWLEGIFTKIVVSIGSEEELINLYNQCVQSGLNTSMIEDIGRTEFNGKKTKTCIAIGPHRAEVLAPYTRHLKLLK